MAKETMKKNLAQADEIVEQPADEAVAAEVAALEDDVLYEEDAVVAEEETAPVEDEADLLKALNDNIDALKQAIAALEAREADLSEKLANARAANMTAQVEKCRVLLLKVVLAKREKKAELKEAESRKMDVELEIFAADLENELNPPVFEETLYDEEEAEAEVEVAAEPEITEQERLWAKAKRGRLVSKVISSIATFACVVGALIYLILSQPDVLNIPFEWMYLAYDAAALVVLWIVAGCIKGAVNTNQRVADAMAPIEEEVEEVVEEVEETPACCTNDLFGLDAEHMEAISEAYAIEQAGPAPKKGDKKTLKVGKHEIALPEVPEKLKKTVKDNADKIVPIAAVCTAVVAAMCISSSRKKSAARRRAADARRDFFNWLS